MAVHIIYPIVSYSKATDDFIATNGINMTIDNIINELTNENKGYHFRIHTNSTYIFFGDIDKFEKGIDFLRESLNTFLTTSYNISFTNDEFKYTKNSSKEGSYHISIPKWNLKTDKLKNIMCNFEKFLKNTYNIKAKNIDTSIYSEHWYRCPNQSKGIGDKINKHIIISGLMENFIIDYIPDYSINIDDIGLINAIVNIKPSANINKRKHKLDSKLDNNYNIQQECVEIEEISISEKTLCINNDDNALSNIISKPNTCKKIFDDCYKKERFDDYNIWITIGMALNNTFDYETALNLFDYFSSKGSKYEGPELTKGKFCSFQKRYDRDGYTIGTIYYYAIADNKPKFFEIMSKNTISLGQTDICKILKVIAGYKFIYKKLGDNYKLYCYNGCYWQQDDIVLRNCISTDLYTFLKKMVVEIYWDVKDFNSIKNKLEKLKDINYKRAIIETYKEYGINNNIDFDNKWWLLGFNNMVYDMKIGKMRAYEFDDYVSITTGYEWREPTDEEISTINDLIISIMPIEAERDTYLQILSSGIDGRCLEKFNIFNGGGRNGKGMMNDLFLYAMGNYAMIGNNGILFESSKTGSNPEKANLHKKRLVVFREPPEKNKFENSIVKELTGGGSISARGHQETETQKELCSTIIIECNKRPLFKEEPTEAETNRIVDILFRCTFVTDETMINPNNNIYMANPILKTVDFKEKHKFALLKILMNAHFKYFSQTYCIKPCETIINRSKEYLEMSCNLIDWFKNNYRKTDLQSFIKINDIFVSFKASEYFNGLIKSEKNKYNKKYVVEYISNNIFFKQFYAERYKDIRNVIKGWEPIPDSEL